jgi:hypothetical protein
MGQKKQHEDKQKRMRQSRDTGKWDKGHSMKTNNRKNSKQETKTMRNTEEIYNVNDFSSNN